MRTEQELVAAIKQIQEENKYATRNVFRKRLNVSIERLVKLHDKGLIVLPAPVPKNKCHLFSDQTKWRKFKLNGSWTTGRGK